MAAQIDQVVLKRFRLDEETLRDLDAVLHDRVVEIDPQLGLRYEVRRDDGLQYTTESVDDVLKERNGKHSRIERLAITSTDEAKLLLQLTFEDSLELRVEGDDRAKIALLGSEIRSLANDRMRASSFRLSVSAQGAASAVGFAAFVVGFTILFAFMAVAVRNDERAIDAYENQVDDLDVASETGEDAALAVYHSALDSRAPDEMVTALVGDHIRELEVSDGYDALDQPDRHANSLLFLAPVVFAGAAFAYVLTFLLVGIALPENRSLFLLGDQVEIERKRQQRRDRVGWTVGVGFIVSIASSAVAAWLI